MAKLRVISGKKVCSIMKRYGFVEIRRKGSHIAMQKKSSTGTVTIPVPDHGEIRLGTLQAIIRQSDIPRSEFEL